MINKRDLRSQTPGMRLREARKQLKISQVELAGLIGYAPETISRIETGRMDFNPKLVEDLFNIGINGYAVLYGLKQRDNNLNTLIFCSPTYSPVWLDGYKIQRFYDFCMVEKSSVVEDVQSRFIWNGEDFGREIRTGDVLYIDHHCPFKPGDIVVEFADDSMEPALYTVEELRGQENEWLMVGLHESFTCKKKEVADSTAFVGKVRYITRELK